MAILRIDIERALDELVSQEEGMRFQGLAVVLGKKRWRELIANQRKKDFGLDAYAEPRQTPEHIVTDPIFRGLAIALVAGEVASLLISRMAFPVLYFIVNRGTGTMALHQAST